MHGCVIVYQEHLHKIQNLNIFSVTRLQTSDPSNFYSYVSISPLGQAPLPLRSVFFLIFTLTYQTLFFHFVSQLYRKIEYQRLVVDMQHNQPFWHRLCCIISTCKVQGDEILVFRVFGCKIIFALTSPFLLISLSSCRYLQTTIQKKIGMTLKMETKNKQNQRI